MENLESQEEEIIISRTESFHRLLKNIETTKSSNIFKVPPKLLDVRESAFLPEIFSFGPFHYGEYKMYDNIKNRHLLRLFGGEAGKTNRSGTIEDIESQSRNIVRFEEVFRAMIDLEVKTRQCYDNHELIDEYDRYEFSWMMVIDGCFIVELLRSYDWFMTYGKGNQLDSPIFEARWVFPSLQRDLIKLENQIPFFLLEKFFLMTTSGNDELSLKDLFVAFFCSMLSLKKSVYLLDPCPTRNYAHPLDLFRSSIVFSMRKKREQNEEEVCKICMDNPKLIYSAQELQNAGIKIIRKDNSSLLDISFDFQMGVLQIPPLSIDENVTVALLNFAAYEQGDQSQKPYFINYLLFLDSLINTIKDVEILYENKIIRYPLGTEEDVANYSNNFCKHTLYSSNQNYLSSDIFAMNRFCDAFYRSTWRYWWALKKERFSVAAIFLSIVTLIQTIYTMVSYYNRN